MSNIVFSIIIPTHNNENYIFSSLMSVLKQANDTMEIVIINDGSTDRTHDEILRALATKHTANVKYIQQDNKGISATRNVGLDLSSGEYILFIDGDDLWFDNLMDVIYPIVKNEKPDLIDFEYIRFNDDAELPEKSQIKDVQHAIHKNSDSVLRERFKRSHWHVWSRVFRKDILGDHKFPNSGRYEDMYFTPWLYFKSENIVSIKAPLYLYRTNHSGITQNLLVDDINNMTDTLEHTISEFDSHAHTPKKQELLKLVILNCLLEIKTIHKKIYGYYKYDKKICDIIKRSSVFIDKNETKGSIVFHMKHPHLITKVSKFLYAFKR
ncbi:glycosyltransferase family 2 protein [Enterobacter sp. KBR-315C3_2022]|uniref:glycosyltransferase family 2 protein n=1 Tax=Enterobacter sp. KBR-315C3_2022 TaxID=3242494 RepID=UPI0035298D20